MPYALRQARSHAEMGIDIISDAICCGAYKYQPNIRFVWRGGNPKGVCNARSGKGRGPFEARVRERRTLWKALKHAAPHASLSRAHLRSASSGSEQPGTFARQHAIKGQAGMKWRGAPVLSAKGRIAAQHIGITSQIPDPGVHLNTGRQKKNPAPHQ